MANDFRKLKNPEPVIPGRPVPWQIGGTGQTAGDRRTYRALRELENVKTELGDVDLDNANAPTENDVLIFIDDVWVPVDKTALLSLDDLTTVSLVAPALDDVLTFDGTEWTNAPITEFLTLDDLSDVTIAAGAEGDFIVLNSLGEWTNRQWTPGDFGIGAAATRGPFEITESEVSTFFSESTEGGSGIRGWRIDKTDAAELTPHGITWRVANTRRWDVGMDFATNVDGNSYFAILDHTANAAAAADVFAISPESHSTVSATCKYQLGRLVGTPAAQTDFMVLNGGDDATALGGLRINYWADSTSRHALHVLNRHGTSRRAGINFDDLWVLQTDADADGGQEIGFSTGGVTHWTLLGPGQVAQFYVDAGTTNLTYAYRLQHNTSGVSAAGFGVGMQFYGETATGADAEIASIGSVLTDTTNGSHAGYITLGANTAGAGVERVRLHGDGRAGVASGGANPLATGVEWNITKAAAAAPSIKTYLQVLGVADTALTASTEASDIIFNLGRTVTFATGALTDQRAIRVTAPTYAFAGASTLTNPSTLYIDNAPVLGANATFTNGPYALFVDAGLARFDGNGSHYFELPTADTTAAGAYKGRLPIIVNGVTQYLHYYDA
jgi:hypothetical protein